MSKREYDYENPQAWPTRPEPGVEPDEEEHRGYLEPELEGLRSTERSHARNLATAEQSVLTYRAELDHTRARIAAVEAVLRERGV